MFLSLNIHICKHGRNVMINELNEIKFVQMQGEQTWGEEVSSKTPELDSCPWPKWAHSSQIGLKASCLWVASTLILSRSPPLGEFAWNEGIFQIIAPSFPNCDLSAISDLAIISGDLARPYSACSWHFDYFWYQRCRSEKEQSRNIPKVANVTAVCRKV